MPSEFEVAVVTHTNACTKAFSETDFTEDLKKLVPAEESALQSADEPRQRHEADHQQGRTGRLGRRHGTRRRHRHQIRIAHDRRAGRIYVDDRQAVVPGRIAGRNRIPARIENREAELIRCRPRLQVRRQVQVEGERAAGREELRKDIRERTLGEGYSGRHVPAEAARRIRAIHQSGAASAKGEAA